MVIGASVKMGYFAQHAMELIDPALTVFENLQNAHPLASRGSLHNILGAFGFSGDDVEKKCSILSGGEKARVVLSSMLYNPPNFLVLDEPTNHLDLEMREALTLALQTYAGAVLVISHDRHLLRNTVDDFLLVANGRVEEFNGDLDDYHQWLSQQHNSEDKKTVEQEDGGDKVDRKQQRQEAAALRKQLQPLRKKVQAAERQVDKWQSQLDDLEQQLGDTTLYDAERKNELQELLQQQGQLKQKLAQAEEDWMELSETYEEMEAQVK